MPELESPFEHLDDLIEHDKLPEAFEFLAGHFRREQKYPELFEILKAKARFELGLPLHFQGESEGLGGELQRKLEDKLLDACRETGTLLMRNGEITHGWMYLEPIPNRKLVQSIIDSIQVNDQNVDEVIEVALGQWGSPQFGYELMLKHRGLCNSITFYDTQVVVQNNMIQRQLAELLVGHLYSELCENVCRCIGEKPGEELAESDAGSLGTLIENRSWLFEGCGHHLDVTHLAAVVRIGRICEEKSSLARALELSEYGCNLDKQICLEGQPPFSQLYFSHKLFYQAQLGIKTDESVRYFEQQINSAENADDQDRSREVLIELLSRSGDSSGAIEQAILHHSKLENEVAPLLWIDLARSTEDRERLQQFFASTGNLLGYCFSSIKNQNQHVIKKPGQTDRAESN